jgi:phosphosulfolactate synthase
MPELAWDGVIARARTGLGARPRSVGLNMILDKGLGTVATQDVLEVGADHIDHWKLSFGTSVFVRPEVLRHKLELLARHQVLTFPGGTLLEAAVVQGHCRPYMERARQLGFSAVEVSDGTIPLPAERRRNMIACARDAGLIPITEVGKKDPRQQPTPNQLAEEALQDLEWGARWVVVEGREGGTSVGIYDDAGRVLEQALETIARAMGDQVGRLIWEAPQMRQQADLIARFGETVNLGNIPPHEILALESLRAGLRFETLKPIAEELQRRGGWSPEAQEPLAADPVPVDERGVVPAADWD